MSLSAITPFAGRGERRPGKFAGMATAALLGTSFAHAQGPVDDPTDVLPVLTGELAQPLREIHFDARCQSTPVPLPDRNAAEDLIENAPRAGKPLQQPDYPAAARREGKEGTTSMLVLINEDGRVVRAIVERSSGHRELDHASLEGTRRWQFDPLFRDGKAVCAWGRFATTFNTFDAKEERALRATDAKAYDLAAILLSRDRLETSLKRSPLLQETPSAARILSQSDTDVIGRKDLQKLQKKYADLVSANLTGEEIQEVTRFYQSPAGARWMLVHAGIDRAVADEFALRIGAAACQIHLLQWNSRAAGSPEPSRARVEKVIDANGRYCVCAAPQFARGLMIADPVGRSALLDDIEAAGKCGRPAQVK